MKQPARRFVVSSEASQLVASPARGRSGGGGPFCLPAAIQRRRVSFVRLFRAIWFLTIGLPALIAAARANEIKSFLDDFAIIALQREHGGGQAGQLIKWIKPIRVGITGEKAAFYAPALAQHLTDLREISGHDIAPVAAGIAEVMVVLVPRVNAEEIERFRFLYRPLFKSDELYAAQIEAIRDNRFNAVCLATLRTSRRGEISGAVIFIPTDRGVSLVWQCLIEEVTQILGLPNDSDDNQDSIFNDRSPFVALTAKDKRMLRLLYDARLKPGMREAEVRRIAAEILKDAMNAGR